MTGPRDENRTVTENVTEIAVAVVVRDEAVLVGRRADDVPLAGFHEFPGGKIEPDESPAAAALRECREESGVDATVVGPLSIVEHRYPHGTVRLHFFECRTQDDATAPRAPFQWTRLADLANCRFPEANDEIVARLLSRCSAD